jgi:hypothetical protein
MECADPSLAIEQTFSKSARGVEAHDIERLRRSIAALQGGSARPLTKEAALKLWTR